MFGVVLGFFLLSSRWILSGTLGGVAGAPYVLWNSKSGILKMSLWSLCELNMRYACDCSGASTGSKMSRVIQKFKMQKVYFGVLHRASASAACVEFPLFAFLQNSYNVSSVQPHSTDNYADFTSVCRRKSPFYRKYLNVKRGDETMDLFHFNSRI